MERQFLASFILSAAAIAAFVFGVNLYIDPYARWARPSADDMLVDVDGFDRTPAYTLNRRLFKLIAFERWAAGSANGGLSILVGDSTINQVDAGELTWRTNQPWYNLAYGGAGLDETIDLVEYVIENHDVEEIVWGLPFNRFISGAPNDIPRTIEMAISPIRHMMTIESLEASYLVLRTNWFGIEFNDPRLDTGDEDIVTYQLSRSRAEIAGRPWPAGLVRRLDAMIRRAERRGVEVVVFCPPVHPRTQAMYEVEFPGRYVRYLNLMSAYDAIDLNDPEHRADWPAELFADSNHLHEVYKPRLVRELAGLM
ncbi:hypothetical protein [Geminicoccus flavidas]|uniref:hypothetical protein n=1 Tax=Geminicoccus flavidas TaxID=2506407 RepID=UPI00135C1294|nr:hypothetical protein [Geminicoccus flavidas]